MLEQAGRMSVPAGQVLDAGVAIWTVIDGLSSALSTAYRNSELERLRRAEQRRNAPVEDLWGFCGDPAAERVCHGWLPMPGSRARGAHQLRTHRSGQPALRESIIVSHKSVRGGQSAQQCAT